MKLTKANIFNKEQNRLAMLLKAFAHPVRIMISNTCICGDLVGGLGLAQTTISQYLKELKSSGLIKGSIEGTSVYYYIDTETWKTLESILKDFLANYKGETICSQ